MANSLQLQALQEQLQEATEQLVLIAGSVKEILQGQQNDRIGLYYSGLSLFLESKTLSEMSLKSTIRAQALRSLTESAYQLKLTMQPDIKYIENQEYNKAKGKI